MNHDEQLYFDFLDGDHDALTQLIEMYKENLTLFIFRYIGNIDDAENIMIDVFANLVVSQKKFKGKSSLKTYIFTIAKNESFRYLKKQSKLKNQISLENAENILSDKGAINEFKILQKEQNLQLYSALNQLHPEYRDVLFFIYFEQMSYKEVGILMKKSEKQITNLAYRGKKALKAKLEEKGFEYKVLFLD